MNVKRLIEELGSLPGNSEVFLLIKNEITGGYMESSCISVSVNKSIITEAKGLHLLAAACKGKEVPEEAKESIEQSTVTLEGYFRILGGEEDE